MKQSVPKYVVGFRFDRRASPPHQKEQTGLAKGRSDERHRRQGRAGRGEYRRDGAREFREETGIETTPERLAVRRSDDGPLRQGRGRLDTFACTHRSVPSRTRKSTTEEQVVAVDTPATLPREVLSNLQWLDTALCQDPEVRLPPVDSNIKGRLRTVELSMTVGGNMSVINSIICDDVIQGFAADSRCDTVVTLDRYFTTLQRQDRVRS
jgi:8-oxo-dGTP pyrophosphatase MutT (NUDIX family)